jgi:hypothetical protein
MLTPEQIETWVIKETMCGGLQHAPADVLEVMLMALNEGYVEFDPFWKVSSQNGCIYWEALHRFYGEQWVIASTRNKTMCYFWSGSTDTASLRQWARLGMRLTGTPAVLEGYRNMLDKRMVIE